MTPRRRSLLTWLSIGLAAGLAYPFLQVWWDCRLPADPRTEACVWGRAYLPVSLVVSGLLGLGAGALVHFFRRGVGGLPGGKG